MTVQEYVGPSLTHFRSDSLHLRLEIAKRLLHFAHNLTSHTEFGFNYFVTDVSYENFAVSNQGSQMFVKLVDVEGILVTDPQSVIKILGHHQQGMYVNPFGGHNSEMRFSTTDLCSHLAADHNFYAICEVSNDHNNNKYRKNIYIQAQFGTHYQMSVYLVLQCLLAEEPCTSDIPGGLLWDVGTLGTNSDWPIRSLIDACQTGSQNRINASYKLIRVIDNVLNVLKNER